MGVSNKLNERLIKFKFMLKLKNQLLIYLILAAFLPMLSAGAYFDYIMREKIKDDVIEKNYTRASHMMDGIDRRIEDANKFADWLCRDTNVLSLLKRNSEEVKRYDTVNKEFIKKLQEQFEYNSIANNIPSLFVVGDNGLDIRNGIEAALIEHNLFSHEGWYLKGKQASGRVFWGNMTDNYTNISVHNYVIPMMRTINDLQTGKSLGALVIFFDEHFFSNIYREFSVNNEEKIYLTDLQGNIIYSNQFANPTNKEEKEQIDAEINKLNFSKDTSENHLEISLNNQPNLMTYVKSSKTDWMLVQVVPMTQIQVQGKLMKNKVLLWIALMVVSSFVLAFILSASFTKPLITLNNEVHQIAEGNFKQSISLKGVNEISELAESINHMKADIEALLENRLEKEREKRIIEIKMLQSQIAPHFLYNTLNSIKVMASLQGAQGIEKMTGSLGKVLKASLGEFHEKITLQEELSILNDYMYIQKIRYKGKVQFYTDLYDEKLLSCKIIKFILQPIVENAIFHGIEPKDEMGEIILSIYEQQGRLMLEVRDDGVGMNEEAVRAIREKEIKNKNSRGSGIGIGNIDQRIKLVYGKEYGIYCESQPGEYTKVIIALPLEIDEKSQFESVL